MYHIQIRLQSNISVGNWSKVSTIITLAGVPSAPTDLKLKALFGTTYNLLWKSPKHPNGPVKYNISVIGYRPYDELLKIQTQNYVTELLQQNITLMVASKFNISIVAYNARYSSVQIFLIKSTNSVVGLQGPFPTQPVAKEITPTSVTLNIKEVSNINGPVTFYEAIVSEDLTYDPPLQFNTTYYNYDIAKNRNLKQYTGKKFIPFKNNTNIKIDLAASIFHNGTYKFGTEFKIFIRFGSVWQNNTQYSPLNGSNSVIVKLSTLVASPKPFISLIVPGMVKLFLYKPLNTTISFYEIIVTQGNTSLPSTTSSLYNYTTARGMNISYYVARKIHSSENNTAVMIGDDMTVNGYFNPVLGDDTSYRFYVRYGRLSRTAIEYSLLSSSVTRLPKNKDASIKVSVDSVSDHEISIKIIPINFSTGVIQLLAVRLNKKDSFTSSLYFMPPVTYEEAHRSPTPVPYIAAEFKVSDLKKETIFELGSEVILNRKRRNTPTSTNGKLESDKYYTFFLLHVSNTGTKTVIFPSHGSYKTDIKVEEKKKESSLSGAVKGGIIGGCIFAVIFGFFIWLLWNIRKNRRADGKSSDDYTSHNSNGHSNLNTASTLDRNSVFTLPKNNVSTTLAQSNVSTLGGNNVSTQGENGVSTLGKNDVENKAGQVNLGYEMDYISSSNTGVKRYSILKYDIHETYAPVPVAEFFDYVDSIKGNNGMEVQFKNLRERSETDDCLYGKDPVNSRKNRYEDVLPYDRCRFILEFDHKNYTSDYINASLISSYITKDAYIATQGPLPYTFNDFWRMVWQSDSETIVMLGQRIENGIIKCALYWPTAVNNEEKYGKLIVRNKSQEKLDGYSITTLLVRYKAEKLRQIKLFHYNGWPDRDVPHRAVGLLSFRESVRTRQGKHTPIIVHCR